MRCLVQCLEGQNQSPGSVLIEILCSRLRPTSHDDIVELILKNALNNLGMPVLVCCDENRLLGLYFQTGDGVEREQLSRA